MGLSQRHHPYFIRSMIATNKQKTNGVERGAATKTAKQCLVWKCSGTETSNSSQSDNWGRKMVFGLDSRLKLVSHSDLIKHFQIYKHKLQYIKTKFSLRPAEITCHITLLPRNMKKRSWFWLVCAVSHAARSRQLNKFTSLHFWKSSQLCQLGVNHENDCVSQSQASFSSEYLFTSLSVFLLWRKIVPTRCF